MNERYHMEFWSEDALRWARPTNLNWNIVHTGGLHPEVFVDGEPLTTPWRLTRDGMIVVQSREQPVSIV